MMRRAIVVLSWAAGVVAVLLIALVAAVLVVDPESYRPAVQRQLSDALGREISIEHLSVAMSLNPAIAVTGLRVANPSWASRPQLVSVNEIAVRLDLLALIDARVEIGSVEIDGLDLLLERDGNGAGNWELPAREHKSGADGAATLPDFDFIAVRDADVGWRETDGSITDVRIESLDAVLRAESPLEVSVTAHYRQERIRAELKSGASLQAALAGGPVTASLALAAAQTRLDLDLALDSLFEPGRIEARIAANGKRVNALSALLDQDLPAWGPYAVSAKLDFDDGRVDVSELRLVLEGLPGEAPFAVSKVIVNSGLFSLGPEVPTSVTLSGRFDDTNFLIDATTAEIASVMNRPDGGVRRVPLNVRAVVGEFKLDVAGEFDFAEDDLSFAIASHVKGDARVPAQILANARLSKALDVDLGSRIVGDMQRVTLSDLAGSVANCTVAGDLTAQYGPRLQISGRAALGRLDIAALDLIDAQPPSSSKKPVRNEPPRWISFLDAVLELQVHEIVGLPVTLSDLSARGTLRDSVLDVRDFRGSVADTPVMADLALQFRKNRPHLVADVSVPVLDVSRLPRNSPEASQHETHALDVPLPLSVLRAMDADVKLDIARFRETPVSIERLRASAQLQRGRLLVPAVDATVAGVTSRSTLILDASRDDARASATIQSDHVDLGRLLAELELESPVTGALGDAGATFDTHGTTLRHWLRNAKIEVSLGPSTLTMKERQQELEIERASVIASPNVPVYAQVQARYGQFPLTLLARGGVLAELVEDQQAWPKLTAELSTVVGKQSVKVFAASALGPLRSGRDVPVRVEMRMPEGQAIVAGTIVELRDAGRTPLDVDVSVKSLARLPLLTEASALPDIPLVASARARIDADVILLDRIKLRAGETDLSGNIHLQRKDRVKLAVDLSGEMIDLRPWIPEKQDKIPPISSNVAVDKGSGRLDKPFDLAAARVIDAVVGLRARRLVGRQLDLDDFVLQAELESGRLDLAASIAEGKTSVGLQYDARADSAVVSARIETKDLALESLKPAAMASPREDWPRISATARFAGIGETPRQVFQSAKGVLLATTGPGRIATNKTPFALQAVSSDLLTTLTPGRKPEDYSYLECAAAHLNVANGVASSPDGIVLRFKRLDIFGSGAVNLVTREILFGFKAVQRQFLSFSVLDLAGDFASIGGTLDKPRVELDTGGVLFKGGAAWATAGLSLLATNFLRKLESTEDVCAAITERGRTAADPVDQFIRSLNLPGTSNPP